MSETNQMRNILLTLRFDGSAFHGWQVQPNAFTAQEALQTAAAKILGTAPNIIGCSRTDAGVHATMFCCNFRCSSGLPCEKLLPALNYYLPEQIAVFDCREVPPEFHARYDCKEKTYRYHIRNSRVRNPFLLRRALLETFPLNADILHAQAQDFVGTHDFASFCAAGGSAKTSVRTISRFDVRRENDDVELFVTADGFLYNMVRIMVGTLLDINKGHLPQGCIPDILAAKNRMAAGVTAPAEGLWLADVRYES